MNPHKLHDKLFKKEQVSPIEVIYNSFSNLGYNVVRRPAGQCLGNLRYFNLFYDKHTHHFYQKNRKLRYCSNFLISDYWKDRVRCFIVWNFGFGRFFPYNDFIEAMVYDYLRYGRKSVPYLKSVQEACSHLLFPCSSMTFPFVHMLFEKQIGFHRETSV